MPRYGLHWTTVDVFPMDACYQREQRSKTCRTRHLTQLDQDGQSSESRLYGVQHGISDQNTRSTSSNGFILALALNDQSLGWLISLIA